MVPAKPIVFTLYMRDSKLEHSMIRKNLVGPQDCTVVSKLLQTTGLPVTTTYVLNSVERAQNAKALYLIREN